MERLHEQLLLVDCPSPLRPQDLGRAILLVRNNGLCTRSRPALLRVFRAVLPIRVVSLHSFAVVDTLSLVLILEQLRLKLIERDVKLEILLHQRLLRLWGLTVYNPFG